MPRRFTVKRLHEIPGVPHPDPGDPEWKPLRHYFAIDAFGVNCFIQPEAGGRVVEDHREKETRHQELYVVVSGRAEFVLEGEPYDCPAVTCVAIRDPEVRRSAIAVEPETTVLVVGATPGRPHEVSDWDARWTTGLPQG
ncbi:MAG: hypothetical protein M3310_03385 [Actinomycetota bacterium]|nr:hypothetical protein [Actinomycetota bacterium]